MITHAYLLHTKLLSDPRPPPASASCTATHPPPISGVPNPQPAHAAASCPRSSTPGAPQACSAAPLPPPPPASTDGAAPLGVLLPKRPAPRPHDLSALSQLGRLRNLTLLRLQHLPTYHPGPYGAACSSAVANTQSSGAGPSGSGAAASPTAGRRGGRTRARAPSTGTGAAAPGAVWPWPWDPVASVPGGADGVLPGAAAVAAAATTAAAAAAAVSASLQQDLESRAANQPGKGQGLQLGPSAAATAAAVLAEVAGSGGGAHAGCAAGPSSPAALAPALLIHDYSPLLRSLAGCTALHSLSVSCNGTQRVGVIVIIGNPLRSRAVHRGFDSSGPAAGRPPGRKNNAGLGVLRAELTAGLHTTAHSWRCSPLLDHRGLSPPGLPRPLLPPAGLTSLDHGCLPALPQLRHLDLSHNALTALPALGHLAGLRVLLLDGNMLPDLPDQVCGLSGSGASGGIATGGHGCARDGAGPNRVGASGAGGKPRRARPGAAAITGCRQRTQEAGIRVGAFVEATAASTQVRAVWHRRTAAPALPLMTLWLLFYMA